MKFTAQSRIALKNIYNHVRKQRKDEVVNYESLIAKYTEYLQKQEISKNTIKNYLADLRKFLDWHQQSNAQSSTFDKSDLDKFGAFIEAKELSAATNRRVTTVARLFTSWCVDNQLLKVAPTREMGSKLRRMKQNLVPQKRWLMVYAVSATVMVLLVGLPIFYKFVLKPSLNVITTLQGQVLGVTPPRFLSFQGRLLNDAGNPVTSPKDFNFKIFTDASGGSQLWDSGTCSIDPDTDGVFSTTLGSSCGSAIGDTVFANDDTTFLQITIEGETLSPRQPIAATPYALNADGIDGIDSLSLLRSDLSDTYEGINSRTLTIQSLLTAGARSNDLFTISQANDGTYDSTGDMLSIAQLDTASSGRGFYLNYLGTGAAFRIDDEATDTSPFIVDASGNVGIGTTNPAAQLELEKVYNYGNGDVTSEIISHTRQLQSDLETGNSRGLDVRASLDDQTGNNRRLNASLTAIRGSVYLNNTSRGYGNIIGIESLLSNYSSQITTNDSYLYKGTFLNSDKYTNIYGLYLPDLSGVAGYAYGVYVVNGTNYFGGNVGIGTTSPTTDLQIGLSSVDHTLIDPGTLDIRYSTDSRTFLTSNIHALLGTGNGAGGIRLQTLIGGNAYIGGAATGNDLMLNPTAGNVGIGTTGPTSILHTVASGAKTADYVGNYLTNIATSSTGSITKTGLSVESTGTWNGSSAINRGLYVNAIGGTTNYSAILLGGNVGIGITTPTAKVAVLGDTTTASLGSELITTTADRNFSSASGNWSGTNWTIGSGVATHTAGANNFIHTFTPTAGVTYQVKATITTTTVGAIRPLLGNEGYPYVGKKIETLTQHTWVITATNTDSLRFEPDANWEGSIDDVTVMQITPTSPILNLVNSDGTDGIIQMRSGGSGLNNMFFSQYSGQSNTTGWGNIALGRWGLIRNTTGYRNISIGNDTMAFNTTGIENTAVGDAALNENSTGSYNTAIGRATLPYNTTGIHNTALGYGALFANNVGSYNVAIGRTLGGNTTGIYNSALGYRAFNNNTTGSNNVALGGEAGRFQADGVTALTIAENSIYLGYGTRGKDNSDSNSIVIGYNAIGLGANSVVLGNDSITTTALKGSVGIGITAPTSILHTVASGAKTANYIGNLLTNTATSSTASITKTGLSVESTGTWDGASSYNRGLNVNISGGTNNNAANFQANAGSAADSSAITFGTYRDNGSGTYTTGLGGDARIRAFSAGASTSVLYGGNFTLALEANSTYTASAGDLYGVNIAPLTLSGAGTKTVTNSYGLNIGGFGGSGVTNAYGLYIANQTGAATLNYSLYSAGGTNYFAGNVGIGVTAPGMPLEIKSDTSENLIKLTDRSDANYRMEFSIPTSPSVAQIRGVNQSIIFRGDNGITLRGGGAGWSNSINLDVVSNMTYGSGTYFVYGEPTWAPTSGTGAYIGYNFSSIINQSVNTGDYTILRVNATESSALGTNKYLANFLKDGSSKVVIESSGEVGIGVTDPDTPLEVLYGGNQLKLSYDGTYNTTFATGSSGYLTVNASGNRVLIDNTDVFVLGNWNASNPTGLAGAMYYDVDESKFKCYGSSWVDCDTVGSGSLPSGTEGQMIYNNGGTWTAFSGMYWNDTTSRLGIGTTTPNAILEIAGSAPYLLVNATAVSGVNEGVRLSTGLRVDDGTTATSGSASLQSFKTSTATSSIDQSTINYISANPGGTSSASYRSLVGKSISASGNAYNFTSANALMGLFYEVIHQGTGLVTGQQGLLAASGTSTANGGDITTNRAIWGRIYNLGTNSANQDTAQGLYLDVSGTGSTITNYYGVYLDTLPSGITNKYGVYVNDTVATNYFGGNVGIGVTDPDTQLEVLYAGNQLKLSYDATDNTTFAVDTNGDLTLTPSGGDVLLVGNFLPSANDTYNLGSDGARWADSFIGPGSIHIGSLTSNEYVINYNNSMSNLEFNYAGSGNAEMVIRSTGQVGIGDTSPYTMLDIEGQVFNQGYFNYGVGMQSTLNTSSEFLTGVVGGFLYSGASGTNATDFVKVVDSVAGVSTGGTVDKLYAYYTGFASNGGTINSGYGLYVDTIYATTSYGIYQASDTNANYFAGNMGIGVTAPATKLDVAGGSVATLGSNLATNGTFDSDTAWTKGTGWTIGGGVASKSAGSASWLLQDMGEAMDKMYQISFDYTRTAGTLSVYIGSILDVVTYSSASGSPTIYVTAFDTGDFYLWADSSFAGTVDNVVVKEVSASLANTTYRNSSGTIKSELRVDGNANLFLGLGAGNFNTTGFYNTASGYNALYSNTTAQYNSAFGYFALKQNTTGHHNTATGTAALRRNVTGFNNTAYGTDAIAYSQTGSYNTVVGSEAGYGVADNSFSNNSLYGYRAGYGLSTGSNNTIIGYKVGDALTTGANNVVIGYDIDLPSSSSANMLNIGNLIYGTTLDGTGTTLSTGNVGIGVADPDTKLEVLYAGNQLKLSYDATYNTTFATGSSGYLTVNASGNRVLIDNTDVFVLGNWNASNPTGLAGAMYYDVDESKFKCYVSSWVDCDTTGSGSLPSGSDGETLYYETETGGWSATNNLFNNGTNVGIGTTIPTSVLHTVGAGAKTADYVGNYLSNTATSSTASVLKTGLSVESTGTWNGSAAVNRGLYINVSGGTTNYAAIFSGGNVGIGTTTPAATLDLNGGLYTIAGSSGGWHVSTDTNTGFYSPSSDKIIFEANGQAGLYVDGTSGSGELGIAVDPNAKLDVYAPNDQTSMDLFQLERGTGGVAGGGQYLTVSSSGLWNYNPYLTVGQDPYIYRGNSYDLGFMRYIGQTFGAYFETGGFLGRNSYFEEDFTFDRGNLTADGAWGDYGKIYAEETATTADCTFSVVDNTVNGIGRIQTDDASQFCNVFNSAAAAGNSHSMYKVDNYPVMIMKVRPSHVGANDNFWVGLQSETNLQSATLPTDGIFFTNNNGTTWTGVTRSGGTSNPITCTSQTVSTTNFALLKFEVISSSEVRFYVDTNAGDGVTWTSCGSSSSNIPSAALTLMLKISSTSTGRQLDVDFVRSIQDDNYTNEGLVSLTPDRALNDENINPLVAEYVPVVGAEDDYRVGDIVAVDKVQAKYFSKTNITYDNMLAGVVAESAEYIGMAERGIIISPDGTRSPRVLMASSGTTRVNVNLTNGEIKAGDYITSSTIPGSGMKATEAGMVVGTALQGFTINDAKSCPVPNNNQLCGTIRILVNPMWYGGRASLAGASQSPIDLTNLESIKLNKDLTVFGSTYLGETSIMGSTMFGANLVIKDGNKIDSLTKTLYLQQMKGGNLDVFSGGIVMTTDGSIKVLGTITAEKFAAGEQARGEVTLTPGQSALRVVKSWDQIPAVVNLTPNYNTKVWVTEINSTGFTVNVDIVAPTSNKVYWWAIW